MKIFSRRGTTAILSLFFLLSAALSAVTAGEIDLPELDAANFTTPLDNSYFPMALGNTYVYLAETDDELIINEITFTFDTRTVMGITCVVLHDVEWVYVEGLGMLKTEETDDWHAWDNFGNVWYFGEETTEYLYDDEWNLIGTSDEGSWEAGVDGAMPGIIMLASPMPGQSYQQEYFEGEAEDMGKVLRLNAEVAVEYGEFDGCLKTKEWTGLEPGHIEHKYYAPGLGLVFIKELKEKTVHVELIDID